MAPRSKLPASAFGFATTPTGLCLTRFGCLYFSDCTDLRSAGWRISEATLKLRRCQPNPALQRTTQPGSRTLICLKSPCSVSAEVANATLNEVAQGRALRPSLFVAPENSV